MNAILCCLALCGTSDKPYPAWVAERADLSALPASSGQRLTDDELNAVAATEPPLPYRELLAGYRLDDGSLWVAAPRGLMLLEPGAPRWRLFHSRYWLPGDVVNDLAVTADGAAVVATNSGFGRLYRKPTTLAAKIAAIHAALRKHHLRDGFVGEISLQKPGDLDSGTFQPSSDNDGLWTALYVAAESFRFATTGDPTARQHARESLEALMRLERATGIPGFVARSTWPIDDNAAQMFGGEWHRADDGSMWWKGDTSSDEVDGHYFAYAVYYDLVADDAEKEEISGYVERITDHILDHGYYYVDQDGKPTTWGVWPPEKLNHDLEWIVERGLNSLEILSHLKVAEHIVGKPRYAEAARVLIERHSYATNTVRQKMLWPPRAVNHSDDQLAFIAYYPLLVYERDPHLRKIYEASVRRSWQIERPEHSPLFNYIYAACLQGAGRSDPAERPAEAGMEPQRYDQAASIEWFREVPQDMIRWHVVNSDRHDLGRMLENRAGQLSATQVLPIGERPLMRFNGDPYELDGGGDGRTRDDGTFVLLPYWMGRYHRLID